MKIESLIKLLLVSSGILFSTTLGSCGTEKALWKEITTYFDSDTITIAEIKRRMSEEAIESIVRVDTLDKCKEIRAFFNSLRNDRNYSIDSDDTSVYIAFYRNDELTPGPFIDVKRKAKDWCIVDVRFGK